jgi:hypothetical protein
LVIVLAHGSSVAGAEEPRATEAAARARTVIRTLRKGLCRARTDAPAVLREALRDTCSPEAEAGARSTAPTREASVPSGVTLRDGSIVDRSRINRPGSIAVDLVAYVSSGLVVGGLLCYPDDGVPHSAVIHIHGGTGGLFHADNVGMIKTCFDWAKLHGRTAFAPSLRGLDGGEGQPELCRGEALDVASAARMLRSLPVADPDRLGIVGGSIGACVALKAAPLIPDLRAVVAFVPPTDWKGFVDFHRSSAYAPGVETLCDGSTRVWDIGGPEMADTFDALICGHPFCDAADYESRSPIPGVASQMAPTLIVSAGADNIVPLDQQVLWSVLRQDLGNTVDLYTVGPCDPPGTPAPTLDAHIHVPGAFHLLSPNSISSGLLFLMRELDAPHPFGGNRSTPDHE